MGGVGVCVAQGGYGVLRATGKGGQENPGFWTQALWIAPDEIIRSEDITGEGRKAIEKIFAGIQVDPGVAAANPIDVLDAIYEGLARQVTNAVTFLGQEALQVVTQDGGREERALNSFFDELFHVRFSIPR